MTNYKKRTEMGVILCSGCGSVISTFETFKVTTYYANCKGKECVPEQLKVDRQPERKIAHVHS